MPDKKKVLPAVKIHEVRTPVLGQTVIFVTDEGHKRAAVITHVWSAQVANLYVFPDASFPLASETPTSVNYDETGIRYSWHWIE